MYWVDINFISLNFFYSFVICILAFNTLEAFVCLLCLYLILALPFKTIAAAVAAIASAEAAAAAPTPMFRMIYKCLS